MIGGKHKHLTETEIVLYYNTVDIGILPDPQEYPDAGKVFGLNHRHSTPSGWTDGPDATDYALNGLSYGCSCSEACGGGACVSNEHYASFASDNHDHYVSGGNTSYTEPNGYVTVFPGTLISGITPYAFSETSNDESPEHLHDGVYEWPHSHSGVYEGPHSDHLVAAKVAHSDHAITADLGGSVAMNYGIHEEAAGTVLELLVNSEVIGQYTGPQIEIRIDGSLQSGSNIVEIQPISTETNKKGSATISASGIMFIEPKKF